jgi:DNA polymerase III gamma/tau subunit
LDWFVLSCFVVLLCLFGLICTAIQRNQTKQTIPNRHSNTTKPDKINQSKQTQQNNETNKINQSKQTQQYNETGQNKSIQTDTTIQRNQTKQTNPNRRSNTTKPNKTNQSKQTQQYNETRQNKQSKQTQQYNETRQNKPIQTDTAIQRNQTKQTNPNRHSNTTKPDKTNQSKHTQRCIAVSAWIGITYGYVPFVVITIPSFFPLLRLNDCNTTGATSESETVYPPGPSEFAPSF